MPACCRCNGSGKCINCSCVKSGSVCWSCLPLRKGNCANNGSRHHDADQPPATDIGTTDQPAAPSESELETGSLEQDAESTRGMSISDYLAPPQECSTIPQLDNRSPVVESGTQQLAGHAQLSDAANIPSSDPEHPRATSLSTNVTTSPPFTPLSSTSFRWGEVSGHILYQNIITAYEEQCPGAKISSLHPLVMLEQTSSRNTLGSSVHTKTRPPSNESHYGPSWSCLGYCYKNPMPQLAPKNLASTLPGA